MVFVEICDGCLTGCSDEHVVLDYDIFDGSMDLEDLQERQKELKEWLVAYPHAAEMIQNYLDKVEEEICDILYTRSDEHGTANN